MSKTKFSRCALVILLSICLVLSMGTTAFGKGAEAFTDVTVNHWAYDYVDDVVWRGIFSGTSTTTFSPDVYMTRGMFVTALNNMHNENASVNNHLSTGYSDVPQGAYYTGAVKWASENGIVNGISSTQFAPNEPITREQMASIIYRYAQHDYIFLPEKVYSGSFKDADKISDYAKTAVEECRKAGILSGTGEGYVDPQGYATRAQVAVMLSVLREIKGGDSGDQYTVKFDTNGGSEIKAVTVDAGYAVKEPDEPTKSGYKFAGWYQDKDLEHEYDFKRQVFQNFTLYADWKRNDDGKPQDVTAKWGSIKLYGEVKTGSDGDVLDFFLPLTEIGNDTIKFTFEDDIYSVDREPNGATARIDNSDDKILNVKVESTFSRGDHIIVTTDDGQEYKLNIYESSQWHINIASGKGTVRIKEVNRGNGNWGDQSSSLIVAELDDMEFEVKPETGYTLKSISITTNDPNTDYNGITELDFTDVGGLGTNYNYTTSNSAAGGYIYKIEVEFQ